LTVDTDALAASLTKVLDSVAEPHVAAVEARERNWYESSFPSELVTVRLADGRRRRLFCKYGRTYFDRVAGHRRGLGYEAQVYRYLRLIEAAPTVRFYGAFGCGDAGTWCIVLEFLSPAVRLNELPANAESAVVAVAATLGAFHRAAEQAICNDNRRLLNTYDDDHYDRWLRSLDVVLGDRNLRWLARLLREPGRIVRPLAGASAVVVHGELYPSNVLVSRGTPFVVDWESAGRGAGEIDLATLLMGRWSERIRSAARSAYASRRWEAGAPYDHVRTSAAATSYALLQLVARAARRA
jgi:aminoglycoside phosphotransferase (APT) family kinase protein